MHLFACLLVKRVQLNGGMGWRECLTYAGIASAAQIGTLTLGKLRQMEKEAGLGPSTKKKADDDVPEEAADSSGQVKD